MRTSHLFFLVLAAGTLVIPMVRQARPEPQAPSLVVSDDQKAFANEPVSLQVSVDPVAESEVLKIVGLVAGTRVLSGVPIENASWQLQAHDANIVQIVPPADFVGTMHVVVALLTQDQKLLGLHPVRLEWCAKNSVAMQNNASPEAKTAVVSPPASSIAATQQMEPPHSSNAHIDAVTMPHLQATSLSFDTTAIRADGLEFRTTVTHMQAAIPPPASAVPTQVPEPTKAEKGANAAADAIPASNPTGVGEDDLLRKANAALAVIHELRFSDRSGQSRLRAMLSHRARTQLGLWVTDSAQR
jgi:hypothetical protein